MECLFCKISRKEVLVEAVYEDESTLAFLDVNPRSTGMCIVIPKNHYSNAWEDEETSSKVFSTAVKVSKAIKKALNPLFVAIAVMPSQTKHFHVRVYPMYEKEIPLIENKPKKIGQEELKKIASMIRKNMEEKQEEVEEEKKIEREEVKRSKEDVYWIKRELSIA